MTSPITDAMVLADKIVREVAELPDRTSPDDWPEAMLVTADELHAIVRAALAAAQAGAHDEDLTDLELEQEWEAIAEAKGFAAGIEAAAQVVERYNAKLIDDFDYCKNIDVPKAIRALRPPATQIESEPCPVCGGSGFSGRGTGYDDVCSECGGQRYLPPPSASELAGAPSEDTRLVTIKLPDGYTSAIEFAKDCGFELIGERSFYVKRD